MPASERTKTALFWPTLCAPLAGGLAALIAKSFAPDLTPTTLGVIFGAGTLLGLLLGEKAIDLISAV